VLVIGAPNSSNSVRLVEVALRAGARRAVLIQHAGEIDWPLFDGVETVGLSAGASAPEVLVDEVIGALRTRYTLVIEETTVTREDVAFNVPRALAS
jgi:4-hydroxy-3-methylbut-2-enyl diphosphate reductase